MTVLKFTAVWCSACLVMKKVFKRMENMHPELKFVNYDYDTDEDMVDKYNIGTTIPVLIFLDDQGLEKFRIVGEKTFDEIEKIIDDMNR